MPLPPRNPDGARGASYERAFSTLGCPGLDLEAVFALARAHGIRSVELRALGGSLDLPGYFLGRWGSPGALAAATAAAGVRIAAFGTSLPLIGASDEDREKFLEIVPWAEAMGVPRLRVFDGKPAAEGAYAEEVANAAGWWRALRAERGWRTDIMVETHDSLLTAGAIRRFVDAAPGTAILWDSHNTWRKGGEDPAATWRAIGPLVAHIHVKDSVSGPGPKSPPRFVLPGAGEFPMASLRAALAGGFTGPLSLEWEKQWHPELAPLGEALSHASGAGWW
jgi:sugar phosphate isomerase/epimerase